MNFTSRLEKEADILIELAIPDLSGNERKYLNECIDTTFVSTVGPFVKRFEEEVAEKTGAAFGTVVSSGTDGLHMALMACGVGRDELVCIPAFTFIATANAVAHCGAEPWLIDIDDASWTMDPELLEKELSGKAYEKDGRLFHKKTGKRIAAVMPVYTMGMPADMDRIRKVANKYKLPLIADAAAAIGARYKGRNIGTLADVTVFSFNGNKTITCGGGGALVGEDREIIERARHIATTARVGQEYDHDMVGYNYRMTNLQAAVGCAQIERLDEFVAKKRYITDYYTGKFKDIPGISLFPKTEWGESACWFAGLVLDGRHEVREVCERLLEKGIRTKPFWKPIYMQKPYVKAERSSMNVTEKIWRYILTLPTSTCLTDAELEKVADAVREILQSV